MQPPPVRPRTPPPKKEEFQPLPRPVMFDFSPDPSGMFKYWKALGPDEQDRVIVYVYRNWPVCDPMQALTPEERAKVRMKELRLVTNIGKLTTPFDPKHWESEIFHRYGTGDYHFKLNDVGLKKNICMFTVRGLRDFDNYPPVLDPKAVVLTDPANSSYLERMRIKGVKFPGDPGYTNEGEDGEDMSSAAEAMKTMANTMERVVMGNQQRGPDVRAAADLKAVESVAEGAKRGFEIMGQAVQQAQAAKADATDPKAYMRDVLEMATALRGKGEGESNQTLTMMTGMFQQMLELQRNSNAMIMEDMKLRLASAERMARDADLRATEFLQKQQTAAATQPNPNNPNQSGQGQNPLGGPVVVGRQPSMLDELEKLLALKDRLDSLGGGAGGDVPGWVPYAAQAFNVLANVGANIAYNLAAAKNGSGAMPPPTPQPITGGNNPEGEAEGDDPGQPGDPQQQFGNVQGGGGMNAVEFVKRLHGPLIKALNDGVPGYEFAARMILHEGALAYHFLAQKPPEELLGLMQLYPPLWADILRFGPAVEGFLNEFVQKEEALGLAEDMRTGAAPPPQPIPLRRAGQPTQPTQPTQPPRQSTGGNQGPVMNQGPQAAPQPAAQPPAASTRTVVSPDGSRVEVITPAPSPRSAGTAGTGPTITRPNGSVNTATPPDQGPQAAAQPTTQPTQQKGKGKGSAGGGGAA